MDGQSGEPDQQCPGRTAENARLVLLCALQRAAPIVQGGDGTKAAALKRRHLEHRIPDQRKFQRHAVIQKVSVCKYVHVSVSQRNVIVGKGVTAQTTAGDPKRHTPRRKASPRAQTNDARTGAHKKGFKQPATSRNTECALRQREQSNTHSIKQPLVQPKHETTP